MGSLSFDFSARTVVVTGAGQGIGKELARLFCDAGADTYLMDPDVETVTAAASELGGRSIVGDVSRTDDAQQAIEQMVSDTGRVDVVVNNAGILRDRMLWRLTDDDWDAVLAVHLSGTFKMIRAAVPAFREQGYGRVVNVTSYTGLHGNLGQANYAAAKAGIVGLTKAAAKDLAGSGVTVNAISPNAETRMIASIPASRRAEIEATIPLGRFAAAEEMAAAVGFLASEEAAYVTGVVLPVDGGVAM